MSIFAYLLLTIALEGAALAILMRKVSLFPQAVLALANCFTWPLLQVLWRNVGINIWLLEFSVAVVEGLILLLLLQPGKKHAWAYAFTVNAVSLGVGILLHGLPAP